MFLAICLTLLVTDAASFSIPKVGVSKIDANKVLKTLQSSKTIQKELAEEGAAVAAAEEEPSESSLPPVVDSTEPVTSADLTKSSTPTSHTTMHDVTTPASLEVISESDTDAPLDADGSVARDKSGAVENELDSGDEPLNLDETVDTEGPESESEVDGNDAVDAEESEDEGEAVDAEESKDGNEAVDAEDEGESMDAEESEDEGESMDAEVSEDGNEAVDAEVSEDGNEAVDAEGSKDSGEAVDAGDESDQNVETNSQTVDELEVEGEADTVDDSKVELQSGTDLELKEDSLDDVEEAEDDYVESGDDIDMSLNDMNDTTDSPLDGFTEVPTGTDTLVNSSDHSESFTSELPWKPTQREEFRGTLSPDYDDYDSATTHYPYHDIEQENEVDVPGKEALGDFYNKEYEYIERNDTLFNEDMSSFKMVSIFLAATFLLICLYVLYNNRRKFTGRGSRYAYSRLGEGGQPLV